MVVPGGLWGGLGRARAKKMLLGDGTLPLLSAIARACRWGPSQGMVQMPAEDVLESAEGPEVPP